MRGNAPYQLRDTNRRDEDRDDHPYDPPPIPDEYPMGVVGRCPFSWPHLTEQPGEYEVKIEWKRKVTADQRTNRGSPRIFRPRHDGQQKEDYRANLIAGELAASELGPCA